VKKPIVITIVVLLLGGAFLLYNHLSAKKVTTAWDLVPSSTVLVYEKGECAECVEGIRNSPVTAMIKKAAALDLPDDSLRILQDVATSFSEPTLVSLHVTRKDQFDFTYYVPRTPVFIQKLNVAVDAVLKNKTYRKTQREFNNVTIHEITSGKKGFSWIELERLWVGSFSPVLIEDVIRTYQNPKGNFRTDLGNVYNLHTVKNDGGNLFINLSHVGELLGIFMKEDPSPLLADFGSAALLDTKITGDQLVLNGFSARSEPDMFLTNFEEQSPIPFALRNMISNRTLMVTSYGLSQGDQFFRRLQKGRRASEINAMQESIRELDEDPSALFGKFSGELAICWLESRKETLLPLMIIHDRNNIQNWSKLFRKIAETKVADTLFVDHYSGYRIFELPEHPFIQQLFSPLLKDFSAGYYVESGNTICVSSDIEELKYFLGDVDQENTWGKSVAQNKFFESTLLEANISIFVNTPRVLTMLESKLHPKWMTFLKENTRIVETLGMGAIQFSHLSDNFYTNVSWSLKPYKPVETPAPRDRFVTVFDSRITSMTVVDSHVDKSREVLVQDSLRNLSLLSGEGKVLWKLALDGQIQGEVHQIDYYNNGKLQYLFCTPGKLHLIDRLGKYVERYPVEISEKNAEFVSVVDYNHNKQYRFLIGSRDGNLWIFDKNGVNLEGWQPRRVEGPLLTAPDHHRLLGRDYMVAIRKDGNIYVMNRRGELLPNFPLDLKTRLAGEYFIDVGKNQSETTFTVVSEDGSKIKFNLQGKVVSREVLVKTALEAKFALVREREGKSYIITRSEPAQFTVLDANGNEIVRSDFIGPRTETRFILPGAGRNFIVVTDKTQELSYIYDRTGRLLSAVPIESAEIEIAQLDNGRIKVFSSLNKSFTATFLQ